MLLSPHAINQQQAITHTALSESLFPLNGVEGEELLLQLFLRQGSQCCVGLCNWEWEWKNLAASTVEVLGHKSAVEALQQPRPVQDREPLQYRASLMLHSGTLPVPFYILQGSSEVQINKN